MFFVHCEAGIRNRYLRRYICSVRMMIISFRSLLYHLVKLYAILEENKFKGCQFDQPQLGQNATFTHKENTEMTLVKKLSPVHAETVQIYSHSLIL